MPKNKTGKIVKCENCGKDVYKTKTHLNYHINNLDELVLNSNIIIPYQDMDINSYRNKIQIKNKTA